jgi:ABC-type proline/glycine betaine transport system permease subunit
VVNLNPYGLEYWEVLTSVDSAMFKMIDEWKSPLTAPALPPEAIAFVMLVVIVAFLAWLGNKERRWSHLAWLCFFYVFFFSARRNLWPLMIVSLASRRLTRTA